ncbi:MAG: hypothetical protein ACWGQW_01810 [bacterium]
MFSDQEVTEFIDDEFGGEIWGQTVDHAALIDPPMEQNGPHLHEEFDMQEWQKLVQLSTPMSEIHDWAEPTCLRVQRVSTGLGRFYYKAGYYNSWGDYDYQEMENTPAPEPQEGQKVEVQVEVEPPVQDTAVVIEEEVKTRMQITLKRQGRNIRGHTGNFVVHGVRAANMVESFSELVESYPKIKRPVQTVRIQFTEYRIDGGAYRSDRGGNMNLHNAEVSTVVAFISARLVSSGFSLRGREWVHESQTTERGIKKTGERLAEIKKIVDGLPDAINVTDVPYSNEVHSGMWCLCRIKQGKSWVLSTSGSVSEILEQQKAIEKFTYILNPSGSMYRQEAKQC